MQKKKANILGLVLGLVAMVVATLSALFGASARSSGFSRIDGDAIVALTLAALAFLFAVGFLIQLVRKEERHLVLARPGGYNPAWPPVGTTALTR
ncbi:MAG TPA: hypothetical protein VGW38_24665 [Chloroflexota bacterium]|nr:hypothetical protein [Chloroflexota bacterium]